MKIDHDTEVACHLKALDRIVEDLDDCVSDKEFTDEMGEALNAIRDGLRDMEESFAEARRTRDNV